MRPSIFRWRFAYALYAYAVYALAFAYSLLPPVAYGQANLAGYWAVQSNQDFQIRGAGPNTADYLGIPINGDARAAALAYSADNVEELHRECEPWPVTYLLMGPFSFHVWATIDPRTAEVQAWHINGSIDRMPMTIWMDGRSAPNSAALHTYAGFTTGVWQGDTLVTTTTHIKDGYLTRNGVPNSNQETVYLFFTRHGDLLTVTGVMHDPVYLTEPYVISRIWKSNPTLDPDFGDFDPAGNLMNCMPEEEDPGISDGYHVATLLPGANPLLNFMPKTYGIPLNAALGGAATMYPEFNRGLQGKYLMPGKCMSNCCGTTASAYFDINVLQCDAPQ